VVYLIFAVNVLLYLFVSLLAARLFYYRGVKYKALRILKKLNLNKSELHYSLDHMIYFIETEVPNPLILDAGRSSLYIKQEFVSALYPRVIGLQIYVRLADNNDLLIGFLDVDQIGFPQLSELAFHDEISENELRIIRAYKALHPQTQEEMLDEVYRLCSQ
jgi:hypothetical protein